MAGINWRISGVTLLVAAVLVLLPALAWLQYSWLDQIADADRERRARTLDTAAAQLAQDFDGELGKAVSGLLIEPAIAEERAWTRYAERYQMWADGAISPEIVDAVYFVEAPPNTPAEEPALRVWNMAARSFDETAWPQELSGLQGRFVHDGRSLMLPPGPRRSERSGERMIRFAPPAPLGDERTVVMPVMRVTFAEPGTGVPLGPPDVRLLGFTVIRFDTEAVARELLPVIVRRHLSDTFGQSEFQVAVIAREDPSRVIFELTPGAAESARARPDATVPLMGPRLNQFLFMARDGRRGTRIELNRHERRDSPPPPPPGAPPASVTDNVVVNVIEARKEGDGVSVQGRSAGDTGHWLLVAKHRAGSLEAAVAAARTRNFILSTGILALLATAIGLIVVSARRADRLARQQLEFVAAVSHELRTPVSVIGAAAGNLADGVVDEPGRVKTYGATIQGEARRLGETVERVLQLAGMASGRFDANRTAFPVAALIDDAVAGSQTEIDAAGATLDVQIAPELLRSPSDPTGVQRLVGDPAALRSALQNLISNAVKYGGETRWVRVTAKPAAHNATRITVEDRGLGIGAEDRKHIFEPFYRGREAVSRQIQGSGLGLHLVRRIVEAHGGRVTVQSEPGQGSTFTIDLPGVHDVLIRRPRTNESAAVARS